MSTIRLQLRTLHQAQQQIKSEAARFNVVDCGRRFGKSTLGEDLAVQPALEGYPVGWFSPNYKFLTEIWRDLIRVFAPVSARVNSTEHRIELITGGVIEAWSLDNRDAGRSRKYKRVIVDEAAMVPYLGQSWNEAISATLADYQGDAWFLSTPKGRNFFWECWQLGQDPLKTDWMSWQMPTLANPFIAPSEIEAQKERLPERVFQQEWLAEFLDDAGGVFRNVVGCATATPQAEAVPDHQYIIGIDWGKKNDFTVLSVLDITTKQQVFIDRFNQIDYHVQIGRLQALCAKFRPVALVPELNSIGEPLVEMLRRAEWAPSVNAFTMTNASKAAIIEGLQLAFERGDIQILNDAVQVGELQAYEMERLPSGATKYGAPESMHDDTVMALALAWWGVSNKREFVYAIV